MPNKENSKRETPKIKVLTSLTILKTPSDKEWQPPNSTTSLPKNGYCDTSKNVHFASQKNSSKKTCQFSKPTM